MTHGLKQPLTSYKTNAYYRYVSFLIALLYAATLVYLIPMDDSIKDRVNYLTYASSSDIIVLRYISGGVLSFFTNEPVWLAINIVLNLFLSSENVVAVIIFFSAFISSYLTLKVNPKYFIFLLFILIFPQFIGKYVVHLRQGLAISIFLLAWFTLSKPWRWFLFGLTPLIHASFFFVIFLLAYTSVLKNLKFAIDVRTIAVVALGLVLGLGLGFIAGLVGARQANEYEFNSTEVSGLGFLFWLGVFVLYWLQGRSFTRENAFAITVLAFYLTTYFLIEVTGRIFESTVVIVLLASLGLTAWRRSAFVGAFVLFMLLSWLLRLNQPWLGWGTGI
ncbi:EpsG family protein [Thiomicrospira sp. R3]|uniref:EpsG family protein n=1 Tax=Thiomicrospira sp. R3 TaxID=3035472 RepID=UPI00259BA795|nr:EpsG family protein [Thiomicrospira sp. R3]WFE68798.1 EpsG family protein [Thiomicrospira sp. R3]